METPTLIGGWVFRLSLLDFGIAGILEAVENTHHRLGVTSLGVPATIVMASSNHPLPVD